jgi:hypothetical protein
MVSRFSTRLFPDYPLLTIGYVGHPHFDWSVVGRIVGKNPDTLPGYAGKQFIET